MGKLRKIAALTTLLVAITLTSTANAHNPPSGGKTIWEHAVDVQRFFINHRALWNSKAGKKAMRWHAHKAYNALIWKWDGVYYCERDDSVGWPTNTGNGYYGGLQMDHSFMRSYGWEFLGWWGTANYWPAWVQMTVAERAYRSGRGFGPWPHCGRYGG